MPANASFAPSGSAETRIETIAEHLEALRHQAESLTSRAASAQQRAVEVRTATAAACAHAAEVAALRETLEKLGSELDGLRIAMQTRGVIEQAKGMLMLQQHCDADQAFESLVELSQTSHRKLVEVARALVTSWAGADRAQP